MSGVLLHAPRVLFVLAVALWASPVLEGGVVIHELHYDPPEGQLYEFVELHNAGNEPVDLSGWGLTSGVRFTIPPGLVIPAGGFVVVARHPEALISGLGIEARWVVGPFAGSLDDDGERIEFRDAQGAIADWVRYEGEAPWDGRARGEGPSLQRLCAEVPARLGTDWTAASPTPLAATRAPVCPPPRPPRAAVAINEIHYHAANLNDAHEEFIELRNNSSVVVDLQGYSFAAGIDYQFAAGARLEPGAIIAVCRDREHVERTFGITGALGNFTGQLANDGERLTLIDGKGALVDSVRYGDQGEWPVAADGLGASLEKVLPDAPSDDPMSWTASNTAAARNRQRATVRGKATSNLLVLQLDRNGECLIDNLSLVDIADPTRNLISSGNFDRGVSFLTFEGSHAASGWDPTGGTDGSGALRIKAKLFPGGKGPQIIGGFSNRVSIDLRSQVQVNGPTYELSFDFQFASGWRGFTAGFVDSAADRGIFWRFDSRPSATPGLPNTVLAAGLPPRVSDVSRSLREPGSADAVTIRARVRAEGPVEFVRLDYTVDLKPPVRTVECLDDGAHGDGGAGDGVHGAALPAFPHNTIVTYRIRAQDGAGKSTVWPPENDPVDVHGYYVNEVRPPSPLPIHHVLLRHTAPERPRDVIRMLDCFHYWTGAFAFRGDLYPGTAMRMRGASVCMTPKPYLKLRFPRGREFEGQRKLNFQALWTDKSLVREVLSFELFQDLDQPSCQVEYVRVHANGQYYGLFTALENADAQMLGRAGLDPDGNLYKSVGSNEGPDGESGWEKKTNENGDFSDLKAFLGGMHASPIGMLRTFFANNTVEEHIISFQLGQILSNNFDFAGHNHYLYHDPVAGKWFFLPWDLDLVFGKAGVFDDSEIIPGFSPWFATAVDGEFQNYLLDRFFSDAGTWYRRAYLVRLFDTLQERFTEEFYEGRLNALRDLLITEQDEDIRMWGRLTDHGGGQFPRDFLSNLARVRFYVHERRQFLLRYLADRSRFTGHERLMITEVNYHPLDRDEDLEFVELWNPGDKPIDLSRWSFRGLEFAFPAGARADANEVFVVAKDPAAFEARYGRTARVFGPYGGNLDNQGGTIEVRDKGPGYQALIDLVRYEDDGAWPREADGLGRTLELAAASPWRDNSRGANWRASLAGGGSPGVVEGVGPAGRHYRRGDSDANGKIDLGDVFTTLGYLFLGAGEPECPAASDLDGDGTVLLGDAIRLLRYLFQGAPDRIPFPGPFECGPAPAESCRVSNCL